MQPCKIEKDLSGIKPINWNRSGNHDDHWEGDMGGLRILSEGGWDLFPVQFSSILPIPHLYQEMLHIDTLALHFDHPRVFKHSPRSRTARCFFFETRRIRQQHASVTLNAALERRGANTYQHSIKYLKEPLHVILCSGSSFNVGIGCLTI